MIKEGYDPKNGARPLRRKIEDEVGSLLSEEIIAEKLVKGDIPTLRLVGKKLKLVKKISEGTSSNIYLTNDGKILKIQEPELPAL